MRLKDKHVLVTGASMGIGAATALAMAKRGARVTVVARNEDRLNQVKELAPAGTVTPIAADLLDSSERQRLWETCGPVDVLVNNAGFGLTKSFSDTTPDEIHDLFELNVIALIDLTQRFLPSMLSNRRGHICNIGSCISYFPAPPLSVYAATKSAVAGFSDALRREVFATGVTVSLIQPGPVRTGFWERAERGNRNDISDKSGAGVPVEWVSSAIIRSVLLDRVPGYATVSVPRPLGASRVLDLPAVSYAIDAFFGAGNRLRSREL